MKIFWDIIQGSPEWFDVRRGIPTASRFKEVATPARCELSKQADALAAELASDVTALAPPFLTESERNKPPNPAMRNGQEQEPAARRFYAAATGRPVRQCGFVLTDDGRWGCSPDGLIVGDYLEPEPRVILGGLELKCPLPKTHAQYLLNGTLPLEHKCQVHGALLVTGCPWWDWMSFCDGMEPLLIRVEPDEFTVKLAAALDA